MEWAKASAATIVCEEKGTTLRDIVQGIMDGAETPDTVMELLGLTADDKGADKIPEIMDIFVPVVNAWKSGGCGGGGCGGCGSGGGGCGSGSEEHAD